MFAECVQLLPLKHKQWQIWHHVSDDMPLYWVCDVPFYLREHRPHSNFQVEQLGKGRLMKCIFTSHCVSIELKWWFLFGVLEMCFPLFYGWLLSIARASSHARTNTDTDTYTTHTLDLYSFRWIFVVAMFRLFPSLAPPKQIDQKTRYDAVLFGSSTECNEKWEKKSSAPTRIQLQGYG